MTVASVQSDGRPDRLPLVTVSIDGRATQMLIDTGSPVSILTADCLPHVQLRPSVLRLRSFTGQAVPVRGEAAVDVECNGQRRQLTAVISDQAGHRPILGRDWLREIRLDGQSVLSVGEERTPEAVEAVHAEVLDSRPGCSRGVEMDARHANQLRLGDSRVTGERQPVTGAMSAPSKPATVGAARGSGAAGARVGRGPAAAATALEAEAESGRGDWPAATEESSGGDTGGGDSGSGCGGGSYEVTAMQAQLEVHATDRGTSRCLLRESHADCAALR